MSAQATAEQRVRGLGVDRRERALLLSIARHWDQHGYGPTVRELQQDLGLSSLSVVAHWIGRLERRGMVVKSAGAARSIRVVGMTEERPGYDEARGSIHRVPVHVQKGVWYRRPRLSGITLGPAIERTIVCLCGSTRFWREFQAASLRETLAGKIVLSIGAASGTDDQHFGGMPAPEYQRVKAGLDRLHLDKIALSDEILILNGGGYMGLSTTREWAYAVAIGRDVRWLEEPAANWHCRLCGLVDLGRDHEEGQMMGDPTIPTPCPQCGEWLSPGAKDPPAEPIKWDPWTEAVPLKGERS